jgi:hypothetical protein
MKVPFWLGLAAFDKRKFPAPEGRFRGRGNLNPNPLLNRLG